MPSRAVSSDWLQLDLRPCCRCLAHLTCQKFPMGVNGFGSSLAERIELQ